MFVFVGIQQVAALDVNPVLTEEILQSRIEELV
jgi:hypothetical protein